MFALYVRPQHDLCGNMIAQTHSITNMLLQAYNVLFEVEFFIEILKGQSCPVWCA